MCRIVCTRIVAQSSFLKLEFLGRHSTDRNNEIIVCTAQGTRFGVQLRGPSVCRILGDRCQHPLSRRVQTIRRDPIPSPQKDFIVPTTRIPTFGVNATANVPDDAAPAYSVTGIWSLLTGCRNGKILMLR